MLPARNYSSSADRRRTGAESVIPHTLPRSPKGPAPHGRPSNFALFGFRDGGTREKNHSRLMWRDPQIIPSAGSARQFNAVGAQPTTLRKTIENETTVQFDNQLVNALAETLQQKFGFATKGELDRAVADVMRRANERSARGPSFSLSRMIRGLRAMKGEAISEATKDADIAYTKALSTGSSPGSYLVPVLQADQIIEMLEVGGIARAAGVRIWPMLGVQKLNVPIALSSPAWIWMA